MRIKLGSELMRLNLAIKVAGRQVRGKIAMLQKEMVTLSVAKWREDELKHLRAS